MLFVQHLKQLEALGALSGGVCGDECFCHLEVLLVLLGRFAELQLQLLRLELFLVPHLLTEPKLVFHLPLFLTLLLQRLGVQFAHLPHEQRRRLNLVQSSLKLLDLLLLRFL